MLARTLGALLALATASATTRAHPLVRATTPGATAATVRAPEAPPTTPTRVESVTVFRTQALVVRRVNARIDDPEAETKLRLGGFPAGLDQTSLQARCSGPSRPTIVGFSVEDVSDAAAAPEPEVAAKVAAEIDALQRTIRQSSDEDRALADAIAHADERSSGLRTLRQVYIQRIQKGEGDAELAGWMEEQSKVEAALESLMTKKRTSELQRRDLGERSAAAQKRIAELQQKPAPVSQRFGVLEVTGRRAGRFTCQLRYLIGGVSWDMRYDARLENDSLELTQLGMVQNASGESWEDVRLSLSTSEPLRSVDLPTATPHVVRSWLRQQVGWHQSHPAARMARESAAAAVAPGRADDRALVIPDGPPVIPPDATLTQRALYATYTAAARATVRTGAAPRRVVLATRALRPELRYLAMPRTAPGAYLTVRAKHDGEFPLLAGDVRLFLGDDLVGHTRVAQVDPGSELALPFGRDDRVRVEREREKRDYREVVVSVADKDKKKPEVRAQEVEDRYVVRVRNDSGRPIALELLDHLPIAGDAVTKVELDQTSTPRAFTNDKDVPGTLRWMLELGKRGTSAVRFAYRVRYPTGHQMIGL